MNSSDLHPEIHPERLPISAALTLNREMKRLYFRRARILHPHVKAVLNDMETLALPESGGDIVFLIGPTGVGKTTLCQALLDRVIQSHAKQLNDDHAIIPAILVDAIATGEERFSWRAFYDDMGEQLHEPLMDRKVEDRVANGRVVVVPVTSASTVAAKRKAVVKAIRHRRTEVSIVDEAVHVFSEIKQEKLANHMNAIKSLAQCANTKIVLVGSYDLYPMARLSAQLTRRTSILHFGRYLSGRDSDVKAFGSSIFNLQRHLPLEAVPDLREYSTALLSSCVGCVGTLKETLQRMLAFALEANGKWSKACLQKALLSVDQVSAITLETIKGERLVGSGIYGKGAPLDADISRDEAA